jgi:hypothetical protein
MQYQRLFAAVDNPFLEAGPAHQLGGKFGVLEFLHIPGNHLRLQTSITR